MTMLLLLTALAQWALAKEICMTGYIMDIYCIELGTLFDNPSLESLESPDQHSVHCLVDVDQCWQSGFEILADPLEGSTTHCRAYRFDAAGNALVLATARASGSRAAGCTECGPSGTIEKGYRATIRGKIVDAGASPQLISVTEVLPADVGCPDGDDLPEDLNCSAGGAQRHIIAHGTLMLLSWGLLLPSGVISARFLKHLPGAKWFQIHRIVQPIGLLLAIIGWGIALSNFQVLETASSGRPLVHAVLGMITMILGILQPLNAIIRPHPEPRTTARKAWEIIHKASGYTAVFLGLLTVLIGTLLARNVKLPQFLYTYIIILIALFIFAVAAWAHGKRYEALKTAEQNGTTSSVNV